MLTSIFAFFATLFVFGTIGFWVLVVASFGWIIYCIDDNESYGSSVFVTIVALCLLYFCGNEESFKSTFMYLLDNKGILISIIALYFVCGVSYSLFRHYIDLQDKKNKYLDEKKKFMSKNGHTEEDWLNNLGSRWAPEYEANVGKIIMRMIYWIPGLIWFLINEPVKRTFKWIYERIANSYERMHNYVMADVISDYKKAEEIQKQNRK